MSELTKSTKEENLSSKEYEDLLDKYQISSSELTPGKLVKGKIIKVTPAYVLVDVGFKSEGMIPLEDFDDPADMKNFNPGDEVEAMLERSNAKEGYLLLSRKKAIAVKALNNLEKAYQNNNWIIGKVIEKTKNGYTVNVCMRLSRTLKNSLATGTNLKSLNLTAKLKMLWCRESCSSRMKGRKEKHKFLPN